MKRWYPTKTLHDVTTWKTSTVRELITKITMQLPNKFLYYGFNSFSG